MDKKLLKECLELLNAKPRPKWGKLTATLRISGIKTIAGRKWRHFDQTGLEMLLEIETLRQELASKKPKKKVAKKKEAENADL